VTFLKSAGRHRALDAMTAEQQREFVLVFTPECDRVWVAMDPGAPRGGLTIDGPRPAQVLDNTDEPSSLQKTDDLQNKSSAVAYENRKASGLEVWLSQKSVLFSR
jgi:hypothetical protein